MSSACDTACVCYYLILKDCKDIAQLGITQHVFSLIPAPCRLEEDKIDLKLRTKGIPVAVCEFQRGTRQLTI